MNTIGGRVRLEREARGIGRAELAKMTGIGYSTLSELERGGMQTSTKLHVIADALGVSVRWLETGKGPKAAGTAPVGDDSDWADISGYAQAIGLGGGPEAQEYAETHKLKFRAESLARKRLRPNALAVMYGKGDSMEPRIHSGDAILFDTSDTNPRDGQMYVIMVDGGGAAKEYHVKRCEVIDDLVFFKADNPRGDHNWRKPKRLDNPRHPIQVIGRVRWIGSWEG
ncbi:helix-turn-helix transcriptional regulator [Stenotrophomonas maltophilia]|nr:cI repressor protein [Stenotrophomonas maltophilia M30]MBA0455552.1 helix-turn-helix transcriptional regulator [Stenotrophomonas maltophilia]